MSLKLKKIDMPSLKPLTEKELADISVMYPDKDGFIRNWLLMGPFPNLGERGSGKIMKGFLTDFLKPLGGEEKIIPDRKQVIHFLDDRYMGRDVAEGRKIVWMPYKSSTWKVDFIDVYGGERKVAYAACYIISDKDADYTLAIGSDDGFKVYLNHKLVLSKATFRGCVKDSDKVSVKIRKGKNLLLVKIDQFSGGWEFALRLLDSKTQKPITDYTLKME